MILQTLSTRQHRVVVRHHHASRPFRPKEFAIHRADSADHAVGLGAIDEIVKRATATLRRHSERPIFDERSSIDKIVEVFSGRPLTGFTAAGHRLRATLIGRDSPSIQRFSKIGAQSIEIDFVADQQTVGGTKIICRLNVLCHCGVQPPL